MSDPLITVHKVVKAVQDLKTSLEEILPGVTGKSSIDEKLKYETFLAEAENEKEQLREQLYEANRELVRINSALVGHSQRIVELNRNMCPECRVISTLTNVHLESKCSGQVHCVIHRRSDHHMRSWPMKWRDDRALMERTCVHGIGHPDPDQFEYWDSIPGTVLEGKRMHGCDGCCIG